MSKELAVPENVRLIRFPPYAPELNPQEHIWDELREKEFPNRVFADLAGVTRQLESGLPKLAANTESVRSKRPTLCCPCCGGEMKIVRTRIKPVFVRQLATEEFGRGAAGREMAM